MPRAGSERTRPSCRAPMRTCVQPLADVGRQHDRALQLLGLTLNSRSPDQLADVVEPLERPLELRPVGVEAVVERPRALVVAVVVVEEFHQRLARVQSAPRRRSSLLEGDVRSAAFADVLGRIDQRRRRSRPSSGSALRRHVEREVGQVARSIAAPRIAVRLDLSSSTPHASSRAAITVSLGPGRPSRPSWSASGPPFRSLPASSIGAARCHDRVRDPAEVGGGALVVGPQPARRAVPRPSVSACSAFCQATASPSLRGPPCRPCR